LSNSYLFWGPFLGHTGVDIVCFNK